MLAQKLVYIIMSIVISLVSYQPSKCDIKITPPSTNEETPAEETTEEAPVTAAGELHPELAAAIAEAKAGGNKGAADLLKRVHKLVDARDTERNGRLAAQQELETTRAELEQAKSAPAKPGGPVSADPVQGHPEVARLNQEIAAVDAYLEFADANPEGGELPDGKGGKEFFDAAKIRNIRRNSEKLRQDLVAERATTAGAVKQAHAAAYQQFHGAALKLYPWIANPKSPESIDMQRMLGALPQLKTFPDHEVVLGDYIRGKQARLAAEKTAATAPRRVVAKVPAKVVTAAPASAPRAKEGDEVERAQKQFEKTGRGTDLAKSFAASRNARLRR